MRLLHPWLCERYLRARLERGIKYTQDVSVSATKRCANTTSSLSRRMQYIFYGHDQRIWLIFFSTRASAFCPRIRNPGPIPTVQKRIIPAQEMPNYHSGRPIWASDAPDPAPSGRMLPLLPCFENGHLQQAGPSMLVSGRLVLTHKQTASQPRNFPPAPATDRRGPYPSYHSVISAANSLLVIQKAVSLYLRILYSASVEFIA